MKLGWRDVYLTLIWNDGKEKKSRQTYDEQPCELWKSDTGGNVMDTLIFRAQQFVRNILATFHEPDAAAATT